jgi:hypothetical protein
MLGVQNQHHDISLAALPQPATLDEYARASEEIESQFRSLPGIVAIYEAGSVSVPGISDLDRVVVISRGHAVPAVWSRLSERARYLAMHSPFLVDQATFRRHRWFAHLEPLRLSLGEAVELENRPFPEYSELLLGVEGLVACLVRVLKQVSTLRLKVRPSLCQLHSVRHGLVLAGLTPENAPDAWRITEEVAELRRSWFALPDPRRSELVKQAAMEAVPALLDALWTLGDQRGSHRLAARELRLGAPWSNVTLAPSDTPRSSVTGAPRVRLPVTRSARVAEIRWRRACLEVPVHPAVLTLLTDPGEAGHRQFRSARGELLREYRTFLATSGRGYSPIGQALSFHTG